MAETSQTGPWVAEGPDARTTAAVVGLLRSLGYAGATAVSSPPGDGLLIVPADARAAWEGRHGTATVLRESPGSSPWPPLRVGYQATCPNLPGGDRLDDRTLSEFIHIGWSGLEKRLRFGRDVPEHWAGYIYLLAALLAPKSPTPDAVKARAERFIFNVDRSNGFRQAAYQWLQGRKVAVAGDFRQQYLLAKLTGQRTVPLKAFGDKPETVLIDLAHQVAAEADAKAWAAMSPYLDVRRGLFKRTLDSPLGTWQFHPVVLCALARRVGRFDLPSEEPTVYPEGAGTGTGPWLEEISPGVFDLRGPLLTDQAQRLDPPDLPWPHDFTEWADLTAQQAELLAVLAPVLPPVPWKGWPDGRPFALCIRHDVDRPLKGEHLSAHLDLERRHGLRSSWYFKRETFDPGLARTILAAGNEVAYHAELASTGDDGFAAELSDWLGGPPGITYHGGMGSEFWRGRRSLVAAATLGMAYAELPVGRLARPVLWWTGDGYLPLTPLPIKYDMFPEKCASHADWVVGVGGLGIVENHPDYCTPEYEAFVRRLVERDPSRLTVAAAVEHCFDNSVLRGPAAGR